MRLIRTDGNIAPLFFRGLLGAFAEVGRDDVVVAGNNTGSILPRLRVVREEFRAFSIKMR